MATCKITSQYVKRTFDGTTDSTGDIAIPNELKDLPIIGIYVVSASGETAFAIRRSANYITVLKSAGGRVINTRVNIVYYTLGG